MPEQNNRFMWYELSTTDTKAASAFYREVAGWTAQTVPMPGMEYTMLKVGEAAVAGLMAQPGEAKAAGAPPSWMGYVSVADVDAASDRVKQLGGAVHVPPTDIPNVGRFSVIADPQGAILALFAAPSGTQAPLPQPQVPGHMSWNELATTDWQKAFEFYGALFDWQKAEAVDIGPMGTYQTFSSGGLSIGGMFNKPAGIPMSFWLFYINVDAIDAAAGRVTAKGGAILNGPMEVPGGGWIVQAKDPQGAMFALIAMRR